MRLSQTRQMLTEQIPSLSQLEIGPSQPEKKKLKSFVATEPIVTNPRVPQPSPVNDKEEEYLLQSGVVPDSLPVSMIPDTQYPPPQAVQDVEWTLQSSFDFTNRLEDSEIGEVGEDTMKDFVKEEPVQEQVKEEDEKATERTSAEHGKNRKPTKKHLNFEDDGDVIKVGGKLEKSPLPAAENSIKIQNKIINIKCNQ